MMIVSRTGRMRKLCLHCYGRGAVRVPFLHFWTRLKRCPVCRGTGLKR